MEVDTLFTGGALFTGTGPALQGMALGVADGTIAAIVAEAEADSIAGPGTKRIDLEGALLAPGFQDAHIHPVSGGVELLQCSLAEAESADRAVQAIADYARDTPDEEWILGAGWSMDHFPGGAPTRGLIDAVVADRPVLLASRDHHSVWANTEAMRIAGIDGTTQDPQDGRIEREADGFPAGTFHEGSADLFDGVRPATSEDLAYRGLLRTQEEMLALGITGWQDAMVRFDEPDLVTAKAYSRSLAEDTLRVHVVGCQWWQRDGGLEQIDDILRRRDERTRNGDLDRHSLGSVKIMVDGVAENFTASMLDPYLDSHGRETCNHGISFIDSDILREAVIRLDGAGIQIHFHALGDRAVRDALDALAAAREANGPNDNRHHLAHLQVVSREDADRFATLDAVATLQTLWATHEEQLDTLTLPFLQEEAKSRQYPFGDLERGGARLAAGSDWPVSSADPLAAIHIAVNRIAPGMDTEPLGGEGQRLDLVTAMAAYTSGSAYVNHRDHDTGYLKEGYLANLTVIAPDPFGLAASDVHTARVKETWIEGRSVYSSAATLSDHSHTAH